MFVCLNVCCVCCGCPGERSGGGKAAPCPRPSGPPSGPAPNCCLLHRQLMSLSFAGMGISMLLMAAGLALPFLSGKVGWLAQHNWLVGWLPASVPCSGGRPFLSPRLAAKCVLSTNAACPLPPPPPPIFSFCCRHGGRRCARGHPGLHLSFARCRPICRPLCAAAGMTGAIALVGTLAYILSFAMGAGPVPGLLVPEITAARIRGQWVRRAALCRIGCLVPGGSCWEAVAGVTAAVVAMVVQLSAG